MDRGGDAPTLAVPMPARNTGGVHFGVWMAPVCEFAKNISYLREEHQSSNHVALSLPALRSHSNDFGLPQVHIRESLLVNVNGGWFAVQVNDGDRDRRVSTAVGLHQHQHCASLVDLSLPGLVWSLVGPDDSCGRT